MKFKYVLVSIILLFLGQGVNAQFFKKLKKRAEQAAEETVIRKTEQKTEEAIDSLTEKPFKKKKKRKGNNQDEEVYEESYEEEAEESSQPVLWTAYNFVPGDEIIFYDDLTGEENGEFPSRWDILKGNAENASYNGENVIGLKHGSIIMPLMDTSDYLPEVFTLEFDIYFDVKKFSYRSNYSLRLGPETGSHYFGEGNKDWITAIGIKKNGVKFSTDVNGVRKNFADSKSELEELGQGAWRHIAIAFNKRSFKVFIDEHRLVNIPNLGFKPEMFSIGYSNNYAGDDEIIAVKNIRVAQGGKKLYDQILEEGRFITRGILFDVNQATLKPESMGVINEVGKLMEEHSDLKFEIVGHTDAQGDDEYNLELSQQRANAVMNTLIEIGVGADRLKATGMGEKIPMDNNTTPEGRANNRRVEFVKMGNF